MPQPSVNQMRGPFPAWEAVYLHPKEERGVGEQGESGNSICIVPGEIAQHCISGLTGGERASQKEITFCLGKKSQTTTCGMTTTGFVAAMVPSLPRAPSCSSPTGAANPCRGQGKLRHTGSSNCIKGGQPRGLSYSLSTRQNPLLSFITSHPLTKTW